eukprot:57067-Alexandrium_andersonii.AAC.1
MPGWGSPAPASVAIRVSVDKRERSWSAPRVPSCLGPLWDDHAGQVATGHMLNPGCPPATHPQKLHLSRKPRPGHNLLRQMKA